MALDLSQCAAWLLVFSSEKETECNRKFLSNISYLVSILLKLGASAVLATDGDATSLELAKENAQNNLESEELERLNIQKLLW